MSNFTVNVFDVGEKYKITLKDVAGNEFRIQFNTIEGGIIVNKVSETGSADAILIRPIVTNEIFIK
jgi:hypothetical protein